MHNVPGNYDNRYPSRGGDSVSVCVCVYVCPCVRVCVRVFVKTSNSCVIFACLFFHPVGHRQGTVLQQSIDHSTGRKRW